MTVDELIGWIEYVTASGIVSGIDPPTNDKPFTTVHLYEDISELQKKAIKQGLPITCALRYEVECQK